MKKILKNMLLFVSGLFVFTSCANFHDGGSVWQGFTWILPTVTAIGTAIFGYKAYKASKSGSNLIEGGVITDKEGGNVPLYEIGWFYFAVGCLIATIFIIANIVSNR